MKFVIDRNAFVAALAPAAAITNRRSPSPFGSALVLRVSPERVVVQSRDHTASVRATVPADVATGGVVAVPADDLLDRVKAMLNGAITVDVTKGKLRLTLGKRDYTMRVYESAEAFPAFPQMPDGPIALTRATLMDAIQAVLYASADENDAAVPDAFKGVSLVVSSGTNSVQATASDRKRFARAIVPSSDGADWTGFIPAKVAAFVASAPGTRVIVASSDTTVYVRCDGVEMACQLPAGAMPPYDQVYAFARASEGPEVELASIINAIKGITPDGASGNVPVVLHAANDVLRCDHTSKDGDHSTDEVTTNGSYAWTITAEAKYLLDALRRFNGERVVVCVDDDPAQPLVLRSDATRCIISRIAKAEAA